MVLNYFYTFVYTYYFLLNSSLKWLLDGLSIYLIQQKVKWLMPNRDLGEVLHGFSITDSSVEWVRWAIKKKNAYYEKKTQRSIQKPRLVHFLKTISNSFNSLCNVHTIAFTQTNFEMKLFMSGCHIYEPCLKQLLYQLSINHLLHNIYWLVQNIKFYTVINGMTKVWS